MTLSTLWGKIPIEVFVFFGWEGGGRLGDERGGGGPKCSFVPRSACDIPKVV